MVPCRGRECARTRHGDWSVGHDTPRASLSQPWTPADPRTSGQVGSTAPTSRGARVTPIARTGNDGGMSAPQQSDGDPARDGGQPRSVITSGLPSQLIDTDPDETQEWVDSLDAVVDNAGRGRARYLMLKMLERSREQQGAVPSLLSTDYINTIPPEREPWFPGDEH